MSSSQIQARRNHLKNSRRCQTLLECRIEFLLFANRQPNPFHRPSGSVDSSLPDWSKINMTIGWTELLGWRSRVPEVHMPHAYVWIRTVKIVRGTFRKWGSMTSRLTPGFTLCSAFLRSKEVDAIAAVLGLAIAPEYCSPRIPYAGSSFCKWSITE